MSETNNEVYYNYTQYSQDKNINVIPEDDFKRLIADTFSTMTAILRSTYGPYGSVVVISDQAETTTTKDGYNVCESMAFSNPFKRMVYLAIKKICDRVNKNVGDGTTSCILLAEKIFNSLNDIITTVDNKTRAEDKRNILDILSRIESSLLNQKTITDDLHNTNKNYIKYLPDWALANIISLASNNDMELVNVLTSAFAPKVDSFNIVTSVRNIIVDAKVDKSLGSDVSYSLFYMPGDYRVRVNIDTEIGLMFQNKTDIKMAIYDHVFGSADWERFNAEYDKETPTLIMATGFNHTFLDNEYVRYCANRALTHAPASILLCTIEGSYLQDEISDLCAVLGVTARKLSDATNVDHSKIPTVTMEIFKGNAMCFYNVTRPTEYINRLIYEKDCGNSKSMTRNDTYMNRINALNLSNCDTLVTVTASSSLELKMISDKIDDCTSIVNSACRYGVVPNMLKYAYIRIGEFKSNMSTSLNITDSNEVSLTSQVLDKIQDSICGLFKDIWYSKYGNDSNDENKLSEYHSDLNTVINHMYDQPKTDESSSYNIITNSFVPYGQLPTSAQYDIEVTAAAISIVKYLITSRALIFDAQVQKPYTDLASN